MNEQTATTSRGVLFSTAWPQLAPYIRVEVYDRDGGHVRPRVRFEVDAPPLIMRLLLALTVQCVACGSPIRPVRARSEGPSDRNPGHHYLAVTCDLATRIGCSRGGAARDEYTRLKFALRPDLALLGLKKPRRSKSRRE